MAGASPSLRLLVRAVSRTSTSPSPSAQAAVLQVRHFHCRKTSHARHIHKGVSEAPLLSRISSTPSANPMVISSLHRSRRNFSSSPASRHGHLEPPKPGEELTVTFIDKEGDKHVFKVKEGDNLLDIAQANDLEMEGACGGSCACSTCHVIVDSDHYDLMEEPDDDENDMLDLAFGLTETSRLGCQVKMSKELDGLVVKLPAMTRNLQASDFTSK